ncbi:hypothetical protein Dimus_032318 [Dionaea muscipula]
MVKEKISSPGWYAVSLILPTHFPLHSPMATSIQNTFFHPSPTIAIHSNSNSKNKKWIPPVEPNKFELKPTLKVTSWKESCKEGNVKEAFHSFSDVFAAQDFTHSDPGEVYAPIIELCASEKALSQGQQIHAHVITSGAVYESVFVSTKLVFMYGKCGSLCDAEKLFDYMPQRSIFSWNAMIGAYVFNEKPLEALELYYDLRRSSGVSLDAYTFPSVLQACGMLKKAREGAEVHAYIIKSGFGSYGFVVNAPLVFMYGKCGSLRDAEKLFDYMPQRTIFSWNAMIGAYVSNEKPLEALELYYDLRRSSGVSLDAYTFSSVLQACGMLQKAREGAEVHAYIIKSGFGSHGFVVNALVSMYAKCNDIAGARRLFIRMKEREDNMLWTTIISGYSSTGKCLEALMLFKQMCMAGVDVSSYALVQVLQACKLPSFLRSGTEIHAFTLKSGYITDIYVANALVIMYARCCRIMQAKKVFDRMLVKDSISWNSMLTGLVQNSCFREALECCHKMHKAGVKPDPVTLISILAASGRLEKLVIGMEAHAIAIKNGSDHELRVANTLIDMYSNCHHVNYMDRVFRNMPDRDLISWSTVIAGYAQNGRCIRALEVFKEVQGQGMPIDGTMIGSILLACSDMKWINHAKEIHGYILRNSLSDHDIVMSNILVDVYGECGNIDYASRVFDRIADKDVVSWTSMISAYVDNGLANEALTLYSLMQENGVELDSVAVVSLLTAVASLSALRKGKETHGFLLRKGFVLEGSIASSLVDMYARCGRVEDSFNVFNYFEDKNVVLWTSMINAAGMHGRGDWAVELFSQMENENVYPDHVTFLVLLYACSHSGLIDQGQSFFDIMRLKYRLEPWPEHYACVVDLLGRGNRLNEAYEFVRSTPMGPNAVAWCSFLRACHVHGNKELGEVAAKELLNMDLENPGNYVLISNVFAAIGRWDQVDRVRNRMRGKGLKKNPACSWIEVRNKLHTFMASDKSHPQSEEIYLKLAEIVEVLEKQGGYVPQTKYVFHNVEEEEKAKMLHRHSERLAIAYGLLETSNGKPIRVTKNLRVCGDCHDFIKLVSKFFDREIVVRDASRFHHFLQGTCSCGDFW